MLAALVQHGLVVGSAWGDPSRSLRKASAAVRDFGGRWAAALDCLAEVERVRADVGRVLARTCRRNKRRKAGTFDLLNEVSLLDFC